VCSMATENEGLSTHSSSTSIRVYVNERSEGDGAVVSNPQAAIVSIVPEPIPEAELAAAQQSSKTKTSDAAVLKRV